MQETPSKSASQQTVGSQLRLRYPKATRLLKHSDFERVYRQGRRYSLADLTVFYLPQAEVVEEASANRSSDARRVSGNRFRIGFTVPRALGGAVQRNRIKRRMREAVRLSLPAVRNSQPTDVVMNPRRSVAEIAFGDLRRQVEEALNAVQRGKGSARPARIEAAGKGATPK